MRPALGLGQGVLGPAVPWTKELQCPLYPSFRGRDAHIWAVLHGKQWVTKWASMRGLPAPPHPEGHLDQKAGGSWERERRLQQSGLTIHVQGTPYLHPQPGLTKGVSGSLGHQKALQSPGPEHSF